MRPSMPVLMAGLVVCVLVALLEVAAELVAGVSLDAIAERFA